MSDPTDPLHKLVEIHKISCNDYCIGIFLVLFIKVFFAHKAKAIMKYFKLNEKVSVDKSFMDDVDEDLISYWKAVNGPE